MAPRRTKSNPLVYVAIGFGLIAIVSLSSEVVEWGFDLVGIRPRSSRESSIWAAALVGLVAFVLVMAEHLRRMRHRVAPGHCPKCRYDISGNRNSRCPECGVDLAIMIRCPGCNNHALASFELAGKLTPCPHCSKQRVISGLSEARIVGSPSTL